MKQGFWPKLGLQPSATPPTAQRSPTRTCARPSGPAPRAPSTRTPTGARVRCGPAPHATAAQRSPGSARSQARQRPTPHPARLTGGPRRSSPTSLPFLCFLPSTSDMVTTPRPAFDRTSVGWKAPRRSQPPPRPQTLAYVAPTPYACPDFPPTVRRGAMDAFGYKSWLPEP